VPEILRYLNCFNYSLFQIPHKDSYLYWKLMGKK